MGEDEELEVDDAELFRRAMGDVRPLSSSRRAIPAKRRGAVCPRLQRADRSLPPDGLETGVDLFAVQAGDEMVYRRAGVPETVLRRLRRGHYRLEAEIDLHGMTSADAARALGGFLREAVAAQWRCVRVIHGKGLRSGNRGPVVKNTVNALLRRSEVVLAFVSALPPGGGTGATLVLLAAH